MKQSESITKCWQGHGEPSEKLLSGLKAGAIKDAVSGGTESVATLLADLRRENPSKPVVFVGTGTCGLGAGAQKTLDAAREYLADKKIDVNVVEVGCVGLCSEEPIVDIQLPGRARVSFGNVTGDNVAGLLDSVLLNDAIPEDMVLGQFSSENLKMWETVRCLDEHPFLSKQRRVVLANIGLIDPLSIDEYIARGGYSAMAKVFAGTTPDELCSMIESSGLRGRGGGGFPAGRKWRFALNTEASQKYLICNADEGD
ncbi:MAG: NADH-quinone oxidoreductase subunit F, partial [Kiritimatiellae bacterium]|nr:NADH-quinone oxidoreductase subunit F [Kiritimatiellia bacterium]